MKLSETARYSDVQQREIRLSHRPLWTRLYPPTDALVQALPRCLVERSVSGVGVEQRDVVVRRVDDVPQVATGRHVAEQAAPVDLGGQVCDRVRTRGPSGLRLRVVRNDRVVILLYFHEEPVA